MVVEAREVFGAEGLACGWVHAMLLDVRKDVEKLEDMAFCCAHGVLKAKEMMRTRVDK